MQERRPGPPLTSDRIGRRDALLLFGVAALILLADQLTKTWAVRTLDDRTIDLVWTLRLQLTFNRGGAFGIGQSFGPFLALAGVALVVLLVRTGRLPSGTLVVVAVGLLLGGALGNLSDRAFRAGDGFFGGAVVDFVDLQWWPVFNVADAAIVIGALLLFLGTGAKGERPA